MLRMVLRLRGAEKSEKSSKINRVTLLQMESDFFAYFKLQKIVDETCACRRGPFVRCRKTFGARLDRVAADRRNGRTAVVPHKVQRGLQAESRIPRNHSGPRLRRSPPPPDGCAE